MPSNQQKNPFTAIWDTNSILTPTNNENPTERLKRKKSVNGARKARGDSTLKSESVLSNSAISGTIVNSHMTLKEYEMSSNSSTNGNQPTKSSSDDGEERKSASHLTSDSSKQLDEHVSSSLAMMTDAGVDEAAATDGVSKKVKRKKSSKKGKKSKKSKKREKKEHEQQQFDNPTFVDENPTRTIATEVDHELETMPKNPNQSLVSKT